jgi:hypothetical protein
MKEKQKSKASRFIALGLIHRPAFMVYRLPTPTIFYFGL